MTRGFASGLAQRWPRSKRLTFKEFGLVVLAIMSFLFGLSAAASGTTTTTTSSTLPIVTPCGEPVISLDTGLSPTVGISIEPASGVCGQPDPIVTTSGGLTSGSASTPPNHLNAPIVGVAAVNDSGFWLAGGDGGVLGYGGVGFFGSAATLHLDAPIVGIAATPDDMGYYLVAADGGVFAFGDAVYQGSMAGRPLQAPIVGIATDPLTGGYRLVGADGGIFDFGAPFLGSMVGTRLAQPIVGIATDSTTGGYWLAASDGGVFAFGPPFYGSWTTDATGPIVGIASATGGYFVVDRSGNLASCFAPAPEANDPNPPTACFP